MNNDVQNSLIEDLTPFIIFSVDKHGGTDLTDLHSRRACEKLLNDRSIDYKTILGCYEDTKELSFVVSSVEVELIELMCKQYKQDAYLEVFRNMSAIMFVQSDAGNYRPAEVASLLHTNEDNAIAQDGYSFDTDNDRYYIFQ